MIELKERNADCLAKLQFVFELLGATTEELSLKAKEGRAIGFTKQEIGSILMIKTYAHEAVDQDQLIKLF